MSLPCDVTIFKLERLPQADPKDCFYQLEFGFTNFRDRADVRQVIIAFVSDALCHPSVAIVDTTTTGTDHPEGWWFFCTAEVSVPKTKTEEERGI